MSVTTYKCPNCDGGLQFDPAAQNFSCEYCMSRFTQAEMDAILENAAASEAAPETEAPATPTPDVPDDHLRTYNCPSCGADVTTDETTAATWCYYCHNPVVLHGRLEGAFRPDKVIPFTIDREKAIQTFLQWTAKKWFVPKDFFNRKLIEKMTGVYFPYWLVDGDLTGTLTGTGTKVRSWRVGDTQFTETSHFKVSRTGDIHFEDIPKNALTKETSKLVDGVHPFQSGDLKDFTPTYLTGFQAEKRNVEQQDCQDEVNRDIDGYAQRMLRDTVQGYTGLTGASFSSDNRKLHWDYTLLPVWTLTYKGHDGKIYFYTMNGQTGKVTGVLPLHYPKLIAVAGGIAALVFLALVLLGFGGIV